MKKIYKTILLAGTLTIVIILILMIFYTVYIHSNDNSSAPGAVPFVKINNIIYIYDSSGWTAKELSNDYIMIGIIKGNSLLPANAQNEEAAGCKIGEKIFQASGAPEEIFVYTKLFNGNNGYRYVRFVSKND